MKKIWSWLTGDFFNGVSDILDKTVTTQKEKIELRNQILTLILNSSSQLDSMKADIIQSESKGNFLQRSWRPILMLAFGFILIYNKFIAPAFSLPNAPLEADFWSLLQIGIGGYVVGRSAEQITKTVSQNYTINKNKKQ